MDTKRVLRTTGFTLLAVAAAAALSAILVRDQISRHQRDLFSPHPLRRLAALSYLGGGAAATIATSLLSILFHENGHEKMSIPLWL